MSAMYYKVMPEPPTVQGYGFKKVTATELGDIISRLTKPTYNSRVQSAEPDKIHNYRYVNSAPPPHTPTYCSRRFSTGSQSGQLAKDRKFTEKDLQRLFRRVRRPTKASQYSRVDYEPSETSSVSSRPTSGYPSRPLTATERKKAFYQLSRPTTASRGKDVKECHLCTDEEKETNKNLDVPFKYPHADDKSVTKEEVESIVSRIRAPTRASKRGTMKCFRETPDYESLRKQSENLPLLSGLERSKSIGQIVNRLHYTKGSGHRRYFHGHTPQATPITDYYAVAQA